ncbi:MAG: glycyl-radical enzyme activating protein [Dehalococcoidia bacterium]
MTPERPTPPDGLVFDIKRFAVHDGPGIRTTVFLKGCPLRCAWCHNPEAISSQPEVFFRPQRCIHCLACVEVCPTGAQQVDAAGTRVFDRALCNLSGHCVEVCYSGALEIAGRSMSVAEVMAALCQDTAFYRESGGGVTLSGGEPLLQAEFATAVLRECAAAGIHTALDTCGQLQWKTFEDALPYTDLVLYDVKDMSPEGHRAGTGTSNERIVDNLRRLSERGVPIEIRMVILPGINDSDQQIDAAADLLSSLDSVIGVRLLPYHRLAGSKYHALGRESTMPDIEPPDAADLRRVSDRLAARGLTVHLPA